MSLLGMLIILAGLYVGWNLGANDGANAMGTAVGARVRTIREAVAIVAIGGFLGAVLMGQGVVKTLGKGIVPLDSIDAHTSLLIALAAMFAAGLWLTFATYLGLPVSTTHSAVGAVAGAGLAAGGVPIFWDKLGEIFIAWIATPIGAAAAAYVMYSVVRVVLRFISVSDRVWAWLLTLSGTYVAFAWGGNDVANATGVMVGAGLIDSFWAAALGGVAIALGVAMWGYRVMETVGMRITTLGPAMAFVAELAASVNIHVYTLLGIPVSTTHSIIGAILGVGLVHGRTALNAKTMKDIVLAWAATPVLAGLVAFVLYEAAALIFNGGGIS